MIPRIDDGQRVRVPDEDIAHIVAVVKFPSPIPVTLCRQVVFWTDDLSPDPTLPLCATCARRKDQA